MVFQAEPRVMAAPHPPVTIDVIAYAPVAYSHCLHCESIWQHTHVSAKARCEQLEPSLPPDLRDQYQQLSDWVRRMDEAHGRRVRFRIVDAASVEGCLKSLRYGVRHYPAVIVDGKDKSTGADLESATALIEPRLPARTGGTGRNTRRPTLGPGCLPSSWWGGPPQAPSRPEATPRITPAEY